MSQVPSIDREIGMLTERSIANEKRLESLEEKVDQVLETLQHARGGWRMLMAVGGASAAIAAIITAIWSALRGHR